MRNLPVLARDSRAGFVTDVYFDDARWVVRYVVVDTGHTMPQREVLIDPAAIDRPERKVKLGLQRSQLRPPAHSHA